MKKHLDKLAKKRDEGPGDQPSFRLPDPQPQTMFDSMDEESSVEGDDGSDTPFLDLLGYDPTDMGGFTYLEEQSQEERDRDTEVRQERAKETNKRDKKSTKEALDIATTDLSGDTMRNHGSLMDEIRERVPLAPSIDEGTGYTLQHKTKQINPLHDTKRRGLREQWDKDEHYTEKVDKLEGKTKPDKKKLTRNRQSRDEAREEIARLEEIAGRVELNDAQIEALDTAGWDTDPTSLQMPLSRLKNGPALSPEEFAAIDELGRTAQGMSWLSWAGLYPMMRAIGYLENGKFYDWLRLEAEARIQLASMAYEWGVGKDEKTPAYTLGRHFALRCGDEDKEKEAETERDEDIRNAFIDTMLYTDPTEEVEQAIENGAIQAKTHGKIGAAKQHSFLKTDRRRTDVDRVVNENAQAIRILEKVFILLHAGLQVYDEDLGEHVDLEGVDVARALAHGGRVNIRIPQLSEGQTGHELTDWLGITDSTSKKAQGVGGAVVTRGFGTHHMDIEKNTEEGLGGFYEDGGGMANLRNLYDGTHHWGVNLAGGGLGKHDHNGDVILPDGSHGHMFISFTAPKNDTDGALQIGMETTGPGGASPVGYVHDKNSTEATANPESSFLGHKSDKVGDGSPRGVTRSGLVTHSEQVDSWQETNARFVDLRSINGGDWMSYLTEMHSNFEELKEEDPREALEQLVGPRQNLD